MDNSKRIILTNTNKEGIMNFHEHVEYTDVSKQEIYRQAQAQTSTQQNSNNNSNQPQN